MMMQQSDRVQTQEQSRQLMDGPLKHIRVAALAAALVPLASVFAAPAAAQSACASGGVCGTVFNDTNGNNVQDAGDTGLGGVKVFICQICDGTDTIETETAPDGSYYLGDTGTWTVSVLIPTGYAAVTPDVCCNDAIDSDGVPDGSPYTVATASGSSTDFGFTAASSPNPGTGTPGYWKNHPDAWPVSSITVGSVTYSKADAIKWLGKVGKDKTTTMFSSLVPAMLNVLIGNDGSCVNAAIAAGNAWMAINGPVGSNVAASSYAWSVGEPTHQTLDAYNNGLLCAPHRQ
jgi:hypothetical protein